MFTPTKIKSPVKPAKFQSLNNGIWYYNYNIVEKTVTVRDMYDKKEKEELRYNFVQVRINGKPNLTKCYEAILKAYKDSDGTNLYEAIELDEASKEIKNEIYYNIKVDFGLEEEISPLEKAKKSVIKKIDAYDASDEVNSFFLNGIKVWLNKDTRVGLMNSLTIEKNSGKEESTLWFNNICITINCDAAIQMLSALELYALSCYNVTAQHRVAVQNLTTLDAAMDYDYTAGYPEKLSFTI